MHLHSTSKYAIRIMSYIANNDANMLFHAKNISDELNIPYKFLTKIMSDLVKADLIISVRGRDGGYKIAKDSSTIKVIDIITLFNDETEDDECLLGIGRCDGEEICSMHDKWKEPKNLIKEMFENTSLKDLDGEDFKL